MASFHQAELWALVYTQRSYVSHLLKPSKDVIQAIWTDLIIFDYKRQGNIHIQPTDDTNGDHFIIFK